MTHVLRDQSLHELFVTNKPRLVPDARGLVPKTNGLDQIFTNEKQPDEPQSNYNDALGTQSYVKATIQMIYKLY